MICYICLQHNDHNVVSSSLERLEIILKLSNLFDFDQLLISTQIGSVEETCVSQTLQTVYSTYQRSFIEINEEYNILLNKMNDEFDSTQMINNEKRTSAAKLVNQLYFFPIRYILKMNGTIKSDDESRINVKCAIPTCLIFIKNLVNLIILLKVLHLLSLREHGDLHLHDACHFLTHIIYELEIIEETIAGYDVLSHDILHSKQVIKLQDLLKNCDELLATGHERDTYGSIAFGYLFHTINTINVISSVELRKIDPFVVAFET
ncbi:unnamed protein product [Rotaria sp. Silwood2]|nr:unnamed protein product [Rotaria sp. Silwood2]